MPHLGQRASFPFLQYFMFPFSNLSRNKQVFSPDSQHFDYLIKGILQYFVKVSVLPLSHFLRSPEWYYDGRIHIVKLHHEKM